MNNNKKKITTIVLLLAFLAIAVTGGTLAYFTDTDDAVNTMAMGGVAIIQNETDRYGNAFQQNQALMPAVYTTEINGTNIMDGDLFNPAINNVVDKIVTVTNEAPAGSVNKDAYVRTILAFETNDVYAEGANTNPKDAHWEYFCVNGDFEYLKNGNDFVTIEVNNVKYVLGVKVYADPLAPGNTTTPSLKQIYMSPDANNEVAQLFGDEYTILALSQATQVTGFANAEDALNEAFGEISVANISEVQSWFEDNAITP